MENRKLSGQTAVITGASSGIGKACALALGEAGANVVVNYHKDATEADEVVKAIRDMGSLAISVQADVSNEEDLVEMFKKT